MDELIQTTTQPPQANESGTTAGAGPTEGKPFAPHVGVVAFVPDSWKGLWQPRHQVLFRLTRYFRVAWVEPLPHWRELLRRTDGPANDIQQKDLPEGLDVDERPLRVPFIHRPRRLGERILKGHWRRARRRLIRQGCRKIILYLWRPQFVGALTALPRDASCYHIDDEYTFSDEDLPVTDPERFVLESVDQVFIHSPELLEKKGHLNPRTRFVPNGVDHAAFAAPVPEPPDLAGIPGPRMGYAGMLKTQLDWNLLEGLIRRHPEWSFVFVGAVATQPEMDGILQALAPRANVHFLGPKSTADLAAYPQHLDVCMMPYRSTDYTRYINPLKLYEYLASGSPVVATRLPAVAPFEDVVSLVEPHVDAWSRALRQAMGAGGRQLRQARARRYDWDLLVHDVARELAELVDPDLATALPSPSAPTGRPSAQQSSNSSSSSANSA